MFFASGGPGENFFHVHIVLFFLFIEMPGRNEDAVWRCYAKLKVADKKYFSARCKGCDKVFPGLF